MDDCSKTSFALDDGVWYTHLPAQSRKEDHELDRIAVVWDEHERSLLCLDERDDVVETVLDSVRLLAHILLLLALSNSGSLLVQTLLLLHLSLWAILVEEFDDLCGSVAVESVRKLSDRRRDFQAHVEDLALALEADILGPFHHAREVALGLDVLADTEVAWAALDEGVLPRSTPLAN